jgi:hypothetical protein
VGHDNIVARYGKTFKDGDFLFGLRTPQRIDVDPAGGTDAAEVRVWKWKMRSSGQEITWSGRYLAMWQKVDGNWGYGRISTSRLDVQAVAPVVNPLAQVTVPDRPDCDNRNRPLSGHQPAPH